MQLMRDPNGRRFTLTIASRALFNLKFTVLPVSANTSLVQYLFLRSSGKDPQPGLSGPGMDHMGAMPIRLGLVQQQKPSESAPLHDRLSSSFRSWLLALLSHSARPRHCQKKSKAST